MSAQALATVMGPPLMLHSANVAAGTEVDHAQPIAVLKYLLQIWPQPQTSTASGNVIVKHLKHTEFTVSTHPSNRKIPRAKIKKKKITTNLHTFYSYFFIKIFRS